MSFSLYLLQVNLYLIVFYCFYKLLLSKETYFKLNRFYLMASGILSLLIPLIKIDWLTTQSVSKQVQASVNWNEVMAQASAIVEEHNENNWAKWVVYFYLAGVVFFVVKLIYNLLVAHKHMLSKQVGVAYSFFQRKNVDHQLPLSNIINAHEETHIKQWHSLDILFLEIISVFNWFNPVLYAYRKEIKTVHEFLADEVAANYHGNKSEYAILLLSKAMGVAPNNLLNGFMSKSVLKERIFMLHKERSKKLAILKYGIFLPLFGFLIILSSAFIRENKNLKEVALSVPIKFPFEREILAQEAVIEQAKPTLKTEKLVVLKKDDNSKTNVQDSVESIANNKIPADNKEIQEVENKIYDFVSIEKQPTFPGGIAAFYNYIERNLKYPKEGIENKVQGKVFLSFTVGKNGLLSDFRVTRGLSNSMDEEALRVIRESPRWIPGVQNGRPVNVKYNININFKLEADIPKQLEETEKVSQIRLIGKDNGENKDLHAKEFSKSPLLIIDNVEQSSKKAFGTIDPNTVATISVLKSEQAINLYGVKAINGVLLITTKGHLISDRKVLD